VPQCPRAVSVEYRSWTGEIPEGWGWISGMLDPQDVDAEGTNVLITYYSTADSLEIAEFYSGGIPPQPHLGEMPKLGWLLVSGGFGPGYWRAEYWNPEPTNKIALLRCYTQDNYTVLKIAYFTLLPLPEGLTVGFTEDNRWILIRVEFKDDHPIRKIQVVPQNRDSRPYITRRDNVVVVTLPQKPPDIPPPPLGEVYRYLNISGNLIENREATIEFYVHKRWIDETNVDKDKVRMLRYNGTQWVELPTERTHSDNESEYYSARIEGTSIFAIVAKTKKVPAWCTLPLNLALITIAIVAALGALYWFRFRR
jgi:PGF-pre-PGF domain-containing protein